MGFFHVGTISADVTFLAQFWGRSEDADCRTFTFPSCFRALPIPRWLSECRNGRNLAKNDVPKNDDISGHRFSRTIAISWPPSVLRKRARQTFGALLSLSGTLSFSSYNNDTGRLLVPLQISKPNQSAYCCLF